MSSLDDLAERCGRCATTFAEADREVAASLRIIDEIVRESARDTRVYFPGVLARVWVDAHSSIHAIDQRLSMTVATLETAASALEAIRDADDADQVIDALEAEHLDLNRIGTSVTSCQEDLGALIAEGTIAFGNSRKGARVLRHLSHALALVTPAATALAPAITERMVLITSLLEPYDEPTLQRFNAGAAAHDAIDTLTDLVAFGQNLLATLRLAEDSLNATADLVDQATERAEGMSPRRLPVSWDETREQITSASDPVHEAVKAITELLRSLEDVAPLETRGAIRRALDDGQTDLVSIRAELAQARWHAVWIGTSLPVRPRRRDPAWLIQGIAQSAEVAVSSAIDECDRFMSLYSALVAVDHD